MKSLVAHILRMGGGETYAHVGSGFSHHLQQRREIHFSSILIFIEITVDILSEKCRLPETALTKVGEFAENRFRFAATFAATGVRYNTVGAEIIASAHDGYEASDACPDTLRHDIAVCLSLGQHRIYGGLTCLGSSHEIGDIKIRVRTSHDIHPMFLYQLLFQTLRHTSYYAENNVMTRLATQRVPIV